MEGGLATAVVPAALWLSVSADQVATKGVMESRDCLQDNPGAGVVRSPFAVARRMGAADRTGRREEEAAGRMVRWKAEVARTARAAEAAGRTERLEEEADRMEPLEEEVGRMGRLGEEVDCTERFEAAVDRTGHLGDTAGFGTGLVVRRAGEAGTGCRVAGSRLRAGSHSTAAGMNPDPALGPVLGPGELREVGIVDTARLCSGAHPEAGRRSLVAAGVDRNRVAASSCCYLAWCVKNARPREWMA